MPDAELDVRPLRKVEKHPVIFDTFDALAVGKSFVLVNNHDPRHLRDEFDTECPGGYGWEYLDAEPGVWRIRITRLASTSLPRVVGNTGGMGSDPDFTGAVWKLQMRRRDLDSNIIQLPPGATIDAHEGPSLDVLLVILDGAGTLTTELATVELKPGEIVWLPSRSRRQFAASSRGLRYLTVHQRRQSLVLAATGGRANR